MAVSWVVYRVVLGYMVPAAKYDPIIEQLRFPVVTHNSTEI